MEEKVNCEVNSSDEYKKTLPTSSSPQTTVEIITKERDDPWNVLDCHNPNQMICPHCQNPVVPVVVYKMGFLAPLVTCFMILTCIFILFAWLPLTDRRLKTIIHYCPTCHREIRRLTRM